MKDEFEFIQNLRKKYSLNLIGDDCAVLPKNDESDMVVTADMLVEDIDFRLDWTIAEFLGHRALAVSLSDIAAMGATPTWSILSIGLPEIIWHSNFLDEFYAGWHSLAVKFNVELVGGDISRTPDKIVIDSVVGGDVPRGKAILRSGANAGDLVVVTGSFGGAAGGLKLLEAGRTILGSSGPEHELMDRQLRPMPQISFAKDIRDSPGVSAMIDISDGLSSDFTHLCSASNVGARIFSERIPTDPNLSVLELDRRQELDLALHGGEDFELLFTAGPKTISDFESADFSVIGEITSTPRVIELIRDGQTEILESKGYRHF
ncbi:MAG: thiamine-phosphate kinase [Acidobacteriota bacterium]